MKAEIIKQAIGIKIELSLQEFKAFKYWFSNRNTNLSNIFTNQEFKDGEDIAITIATQKISL